MPPSFRTLTAAAAVALAFAGVISASASPPAAAATPAGACADDANATQVLSAEGQKAFGGPVSCAVLASVHACNHPTHGARVREHCKATCGACPGTCDPDDATVDVATATTDTNSATAATAATDVNTTAAVPGDDDDDGSASASLTFCQVGDLCHRSLLAKVANLEKELVAVKAQNEVVAVVTHLLKGGQGPAIWTPGLREGYVPLTPAELRAGVKAPDLMPDIADWGPGFDLGEMVEGGEVEYVVYMYYHRLWEKACDRATQGDRCVRPPLPTFNSITGTWGPRK